MKFRKKPLVIDGKQYDGSNAHDLLQWAFELGLEKPQKTFLVYDDLFLIKTLEGAFRVDPGDWIIRGIEGEYYSCKPDIFEATYEVVPNKD